MCRLLILHILQSNRVTPTGLNFLQVHEILCHSEPIQGLRFCGPLLLGPLRDSKETREWVQGEWEEGARGPAWIEPYYVEPESSSPSHL